VLSVVVAVFSDDIVKLLIRREEHVSNVLDHLVEAPELQFLHLVFIELRTH
jgi:hypothetical protein